MIRIGVGGCYTGEDGGGVKGTDTERKRAQGLFDLIGLGGDVDRLLIAFVFTEVMSLADVLRVNSLKYIMSKSGFINFMRNFK